MNPSMQTCLDTFKFGNDVFLQKIATIDDDAARQRIAADVSPVIWVAGHLLNSRRYLLELLGESRELPNGSLFQKKFDPSADYPPMAEIKSAWVSISDELFATMEQAGDDHFLKEIDMNLPIGDKTVRGAVLFFTYHEGWHFGQISYARKGMGMEGLLPY
jgi:hypothetical protein